METASASISRISRWCALCVGKVAFVNVAKHDVTGFMEEGFYWESGNRADRDLPTTFRVALGVAVQVFERDTLDVQGSKGSFFVPIRDGGRLVFCAIGLCKYEPMGLVGEMGKGKFLFLVGAVIFLDRLGALAGQRHT